MVCERCLSLPRGAGTVSFTVRRGLASPNLEQELRTQKQTTAQEYCYQFVVHLFCCNINLNFIQHFVGRELSVYRLINCQRLSETCHVCFEAAGTYITGNNEPSDYTQSSVSKSRECLKCPKYV